MKLSGLLEIFRLISNTKNIISRNKGTFEHPGQPHALPLYSHILPVASPLPYFRRHIGLADKINGCGTVSVYTKFSRNRRFYSIHKF